MNQIDIGEAIPAGLCPDCLERMVRGAAYEAVDLPGGRRLIHAYCAHRQAGASLLVRPDRPLRWRIDTPIDALEWRHFMQIRAAEYRGLFEDGVDSANVH